MRKIVLSLISCFFLASLYGQSMVKLSIDTNYIEIGDQVHLIQEVTLGSNADFISASLHVFDSVYKTGMEEKNFELFEIIDSSEWMIAGNKRNRSITFTAWEAGRYAIPSSILNYRINGRVGQATSNSLNIQVNSPKDPNVPNVDSLKLAPIKPIIVTPMDLWKDLIRPGLLLLAVLLGLCLLVYFLYRLFSKDTAILRDPNYIYPQHIANFRLEKIQEEQAWVKGDIKKYHTDLTFAIREYLENRFQVNALEMSTGEIMAAIKKGDINPSWVDQLQSLFTTADMVKFAKAVPPFDLHNQTLEKCKTFVRDTQVDSILIELSSEDEKIYDRSLFVKKPKEVAS